MLTASLALVVLALVVAHRGTSSAENGDHPGSTNVSSPDGAKALYLLLDALGHRVERRTTPLGDLGDSRLVFVLGPEQATDGPGVDLEGLLRWIQRGGTIVYAPSWNEQKPTPLRRMLGVRATLGHYFARTRTQTPLTSEWAPARALDATEDARIEVADPDDTVTVLTPDEPVAIEHPLGDGRVIALSGSDVASTERLASADNALFFAILADRYAGDEPIVFDEFAHGFGSLDGVIPLDRGLARVGIALASIAWLLYVWSRGVRLGAISEEAPPRRRATLEQVEALAKFYQRAARRALAAQRLGLPVTGVVRSDEELVRLARAATAKRQLEPHAH